MRMGTLMAQPGIGAVIHMLGGGSQNDPAKYLGRKIVSAELDKEANRVRLSFEDGTKIAIWDDGQSCCEPRYIASDDDFSKIVDADLVAIETKPADDIEDEYGYCHEQTFIDLVTTKGTITFTTHNEHYGYYGGFGLTITEEAASA